MKFFTNSKNFNKKVNFFKFDLQNALPFFCFTVVKQKKGRAFTSFLMVPSEMGANPYVLLSKFYLDEFYFYFYSFLMSTIKYGRHKKGVKVTRGFQKYLPKTK